ncbi:MAG: 5'/3'-nucleotidase SurE [Bacteroidales bacterium]|nr:5'/3'-nucleotidase SurE [Bacteroidales bacterium]
MSYHKPLILVTNDDGINAPGIRKLIEIMRTIGKVVVVAPDKSQSGMGHAITVTSPLRVTKLVEEDDYLEYACSGTPVDSVKLGMKVIMGRKPDLLVSGINHGSNASVNVLYSGTMAAVLEAAIENIPAIGFSLNDYSLKANFDGFEDHIIAIVKQVLENALPHGICLNVNIPALNGSPLKGIKVVRQGVGYWDEAYDERTDPLNRNYYWITGVFRNNDDDLDTDLWALKNNYIAVVPVQVDLTSHDAIHLLKKWNFSNGSKK